MPLSPEELDEFKKHYENAFNIRLSDDEAVELADRLDELYRIVLDRSAAAEDLPKPKGAPWWLKRDGWPGEEGAGGGEA